MKVGSALAAFALFGKSIAISISSDASVESLTSVHDLPHDGAIGFWEALGFGFGDTDFPYSVGSSMTRADVQRMIEGMETSLQFLDQDLEHVE